MTSPAGADVIAPGRVLNAKWTLGAHLGTGGAGSVYLATHRNGTRAAVKLLHPSLAADEEQVARFLREGVIANHLAHRGVAAALDDDRTEDGLVYLVLELLEGSSLAEHIDEHAPLDVDEALAIADQVLDVLRAAHAKDIVHRDVKPANVFLLRDGTVKLLDFGIARAPAPTGDVDLGLAQPTQMGAIFGTPGFMPPEQARGAQELIDARTDLWSVAALLFTMLTGTRLHPATSPNESLARAMLEPCPPVRSILPSLDETVAALVDRGLAFERNDRFPSAERMQGAVRFARLCARNRAAPAASSPPVSRRRPLDPSSQPEGSTALRTMAMAASAALVIGLVMTLAWLGRREEPAAISPANEPVAIVGGDVATPTSPAEPAITSEPSIPAVPGAPAPAAATPPATRPRMAPHVIPPSSTARAQGPRSHPADPLGARR